MGYAVIDPGHMAELATVVTCGLVAVPREASNAERLLAIATALDLLIAEHAPRALALERLFFNKNVRTAMLVSEARGIALLCGARAGLEIAEYTPQEVKLAVTGSGGADKRAVQRMIGLLARLDRPIAQDNIADAIAIALTHAQHAQLAARVATVEGGR